MKKKSAFKRSMTYILPLVLFAAMLLWFLLAMRNTASSTEKNELQALKTNIENSITMCYAIEGAYPDSVEYLCENYGLTYDKDKYILHYDGFASNIRPTVMVFERQAGSEKL